MSVNGSNKGDSSLGSTKAANLPPHDIIFGNSSAMANLRQKIEKVSGTNVPVLMEGEAGTGKELLARWIHEQSPWRSGPFVKVNCAAIPGALLESELFGYEQGAFTGAQTRKLGRVELAHRGTLFLDDITELEQGLQAKLLQFLQDGRFSRIGDSGVQYVETRVICSTNRVMEREIESGNFRADLFYRINVIRIHLPSLRERSEDVPLLSDYFVSHFNKRFERSAPPLSKDLLETFINKDWPGNIRELENRVARYVLLGSEAEPVLAPIRRRSAPVVIETTKEGSIPLKRIARKAVHEMERKVIFDALQANHWNRRKAAEVLKISYRALIYKIREAGLSTKRPLANDGSRMGAAKSKGTATPTTPQVPS